MVRVVVRAVVEFVLVLVVVEKPETEDSSSQHQISPHLAPSKPELEVLA